MQKLYAYLCIFYVFASLNFIYSEESVDRLIAKKVNTNPRYNMTVSDTKKFIWFRVAKVGTRSIYEVLANNNTEISLDDYSLAFNPKQYKGYFKFAFVRNPWDRVVSCYFNKVVGQAGRAYKECFGKDFEYFVGFIERQDLLKADIHIRLQTALIPRKDVNFIGRMENFNEDLIYILRTLHLTHIDIPHKNLSGHQHYSKYYTERTRKIIAKKYKEDIAAFKYRFEEQ